MNKLFIITAILLFSSTIYGGDYDLNQDQNKITPGPEYKELPKPEPTQPKTYTPSKSREQILGYTNDGKMIIKSGNEIHIGNKTITLIED